MYTATTRSICVSVESFYLAEQSEPERKRWVFGYKVTIENRGAEAVQLLTRHWLITDGRGRLHEVQGDGVVGEQPVIKPGRVFAYASGAPLGTPSGIMTGTYRMVSGSGERFDVAIPAFSLDAPEARGALN
jgi:ApaG protein